MNMALRSTKQFLVSENGMETLEYAIIVGLVTSATLIALAAIGIWVAGIYNTVQTTVGA